MPVRVRVPPGLLINYEMKYRVDYILPTGLGGTLRLYIEAPNSIIAKELASAQLPSGSKIQTPVPA